jgi:hypothetical protein
MQSSNGETILWVAEAHYPVDGDEFTHDDIEKSHGFVKQPTGKDAAGKPLKKMTRQQKLQYPTEGIRGWAMGYKLSADGLLASPTNKIVVKIFIGSNVQGMAFFKQFSRLFLVLSRCQYKKGNVCKLEYHAMDQGCKTIGASKTYNDPKKLFPKKLCSQSVLIFPDNPKKLPRPTLRMSTRVPTGMHHALHTHNTILTILTILTIGTHYTRYTRYTHDRYTLYSR